MTTLVHFKVRFNVKIRGAVLLVFVLHTRALFTAFGSVKPTGQGARKVPMNALEKQRTQAVSHNHTLLHRTSFVNPFSVFSPNIFKNQL